MITSHLYSAFIYQFYKASLLEYYHGKRLKEGCENNNILVLLAPLLMTLHISDSSYVTLSR